MKNMTDVILAEQTLEGFAELPDRAGIYVFQQEGQLFSPTVGEKYSVTWNGTSYECTAQDIEGAAIALGNLYYETLETTDDTGEPFLIAVISAEFAENDTGVTVIYTTDAESSNTIGISSVEDEDTEDTEESTGVSITLYDRTGAAITYDNVETITTDTPDAEKGATFTYGVAVENAEYELDFSNGNQKVTLEKGQLMKEFTMVKPENLLPEYIKKNVEVAGVVGEFAGDEMEKTVELEMADGDQVIEADEDTVLTKVTVTKPETLVPENIAENVEIGGVTGILKDNIVGMIEGTIASVNNATVSAIAAYAFYGNTSLEQVSFPNCKTINTSAFVNCSNLKTISFPECTSLVGYSQFSPCKSLQEAIFPKCTSMGSGCTFGWCTSLSYVEFPLCTSIPASAFSSCTGLANVSFPECTYVSNSAFASCKALTSITLENCSYIGQSAFYNCTSLASCSFPNLRELNSTAFTICTSLSTLESSIYYVGDMAVYTTLATTATGTLQLKSDTRLIAMNILYGRSKLTSISGMDSVEIIGSAAFSNCCSAVFGEFSKVKYIGAYAFNRCSMLSLVNIPECSEIGTGAFQYCSALSEVYAPKIDCIDQNAFYYCSNLASVIAPYTKEVLASAFYSCNKLSKIFMPECSFLSNSAFANCNYLETAIIGKYYSASANTFISCYRLMSLYLLGSSCPNVSPGLAYTPISNYSTYTGAYGTIYVRESLLTEYKSKWTTYSSRFVGMTDEEIAALYEQEGYTE